MHRSLAEILSKCVADQLDVLPHARNNGRDGVLGSREPEFGGNKLPAFLDAIGGRNTLGGEDVGRARLQLVLGHDWVGRASTLGKRHR